MKVTFNEFLNEYSGPKKAIGFRYSKPTNEYKLSLKIFVNETEEVVNKQIEEILKKNEFEEDDFTLTLIEDGEYDFEINFKLYSGGEIQGAISTFLLGLKNAYPDFKFDEDSIKIDGEPESYKAKKVVGY